VASLAKKRKNTKRYSMLVSFNYWFK